MIALHLSYHAHLRRLKRIDRAAFGVLHKREPFGTPQELDYFFAVYPRWERLERLAWRQYRRARANKFPT